MMAEKARMFGDTHMLEKIVSSDDPKDMKAYGRKVCNFNIAQWEASSYDIVKRGNRAKFGQNEALKAFLRATGNAILVEASPRDRIWGIGMGRNNPDAPNPCKWRGKNLLGFALTEVRDEMNKQEGI